MKKFISLLLCLASLLSCAACGGQAAVDPTVTQAQTKTAETTAEAPAVTTAAEPETTAAQAAEPEEPVLLYQAHRGVSTDFPENTLPAFQGAIDQGYKFIELDPNFTLDQQCVLMHDSTINRTCRNADGSSLGDAAIALGSIAYADLLKLDAGLFKGEQFKGTKVPLLSEVAELVEGTGVALKLDNKIQNYTDEQLEIIFTLAENSKADIGFTCKDIGFVTRVAERLPGVTIHYDGPIAPVVLKKLAPIAETHELYIWVGINNANETICDMVKEVGHLGIWTLSTDEQLEKAIALGAEVIETNGELKPAK
ncbi:MAG: hypothetical protein IJX53_08615 [Clostridia bacterium]|nr:hypothetical protein [Clostridia bacterium]